MNELWRLFRCRLRAPSTTCASLRSLNVVRRRPVCFVSARLMATKTTRSGLTARSTTAGGILHVHRRSMSWLNRFLKGQRIRSSWTKDDMWALFSWLFVGQGAFILIGTTTFASVILLLANSLQFQEYLAMRIGQYLTKSTGVAVSFGSAIVPNWRDGKITFKNVHLQKRGSDPVNPTLSSDQLLPEQNFTRFELDVDRIDVSLSVARLLEGKGLVRTCAISGVRGVIDRRWTFAAPATKHLHQKGDFDLENVDLKDALVTILNPAGFRPYTVSILSAHFPRLRKQWLFYDILCADPIVGVFDKCLFSLHTPQVNLAELSADNVQSSQRRRHVATTTATTTAAAHTKYPKMRHVKIDRVNVDHMAQGATGPLGWLTRGAVDISAFIQLPSNYVGQPADDIIEAVSTTVESIKDKLLLAILEQANGTRSSDHHQSHPLYPVETSDDASARPPPNKVAEWLTETSLQVSALRTRFFNPLLEKLRQRWRREILNVDETAREPPEAATVHFMHSKPNTVSIKVDMTFHDLHARVPLHSGELSYINNALIRPVVAYINENRPYVPISCYFELDLEKDLNGAWTIYDSGLVDRLSEGVAMSFSRLVSDRNLRLRRIRKVSLWSLYAVLKNVSHVLVPPLTAAIFGSSTTTTTTTTLPSHNEL